MNGSIFEDPAASIADRIACWGVLGATFVCVPTMILGSLSLLSRGSILILTLSLLALAYWVARSSRQTPVWAWPPWPIGLSLGLLMLQTMVSLPIPPDDWDAMTYHLFLPARWLQEGGFVHVPTVFGDDSAAFAPQNGALIFAWWMGLVGSDALVSVVQVAALILLAAAIWLLSARVGSSKPATAMAVATLPWMQPFERWTFSANVDIFLAAFWVAAAAFLFGAGRRRDLLCGGLALGLALGTKTIALPLCLGLVLVAAPRLWRAPRRDVLLFAGATTLTGSFWWLRNAVLYGNPLFPLDISLGNWRLLPGVFGSAALEKSIFHIRGFGQFLQNLDLQWGSSTCALMVLGLLGFALGAQRKRLRFELSLLVVGWFFFVFKVVPHNNQSRFLLPALALSLVGWGRLLESIPQPRRRATIWVGALLALAAASRPDLYLLQRLAWLGSPIDLRTQVLAEADYNLWRDGYLPFNHPGVEPRRIAYSGGNVPYALVGPRLQNHVVYCNVKGNPQDGLWEFWRPDKALRDSYISGIYRGQEDYEDWLACLEGERIDTVVLFWTIPVQVPKEWTYVDGFPIERLWMQQHPDLFRPLLQSERAEIWSVRPWPKASPEGTREDLPDKEAPGR